MDISSRLLLKSLTSSDDFHMSVINDNWATLDSTPGILICTSSTRPSGPSAWGAGQTGRFIYETDTKTLLGWDGAAWYVALPRGERAYVQSLTTFSTTSTAYDTVLTTPSFVASTRRHLIHIEAPRIYSTSGITGCSLWRDGTMLQEWLSQGKTGTAALDQARGLSMTTTDKWAGGACTYLFKIRAETGFTGTCTVEGGTNKPVALTVVEV